RRLGQLAAEESHDDDVDPLPRAIRVLPEQALAAESDPLVGPDRPLVEGVGLEADLVQVELVEREPAERADRVLAESPAAAVRLADRDAENRVPIVAIDLDEAA